MGQGPSLKKGRTIAVSGKGGSGKTMLTTIIVKILARDKNLRVLAIDADSAMSLPYTFWHNNKKDNRGNPASDH